MLVFKQLFAFFKACCSIPLQAYFTVSLTEKGFCTNVPCVIVLNVAAPCTMHFLLSP